jgi:hypothetical protein
MLTAVHATIADRHRAKSPIWISRFAHRVTRHNVLRDGQQFATYCEVYSNGTSHYLKLRFGSDAPIASAAMDSSQMITYGGL